jgi:type VI secretion system secreted protein Hcp
MAFDMFMVLQSTATGGIASTPVTGEPTLDPYYKTFSSSAVAEIRSFSLGVENPTTIGSTSTGAGTGKIRLEEALIEKSVDLMSPSLYQVSARGGHFDKMQVFIRRIGGTTLAPKPYLVYGFNMVFITNIDWSASEGDELPVERVTFAYGALVLGYYQQKPDGTLGTKKTASWNMVTNQEPMATDALTNF